MNAEVESKRFDVEFARQQFPFYQTDLSHWAFFENAGGTLPCRFVLDKLNHYNLYNKVQPYGPNPIAAAAGKQMDKGRQVISDLTGVPVDTLTIGPSTTQNLNTLSMAYAHHLGPGDEIIVSEQDHEANIGGWERVARLTGATLRLWQVDMKSGELHLEALEKLVNPKTKILCMNHSSNIVGTVNPVDKVVEMGHDAGAKVVIDGVSYAPHRWPDLRNMKADVYCFSTYKTYATHLGVMYVKPDFHEQLTPQCHYFNEKKKWAWLDAAGPDHGAIAALAGLEELFLTYYDHHFGSSDKTLNQKTAEVSDLMNRHEMGLCKILLEGLRSLPVRIIGKSDVFGREANVAFQWPGHSSLPIAQMLAEKDISTKNGHFYAYRILKKLGMDPDDGVLRLSLAHYNTEEEITRLVDALNQFIK